MACRQKCALQRHICKNFRNCEKCVHAVGTLDGLSPLDPIFGKGTGGPSRLPSVFTASLSILPLPRAYFYKLFFCLACKAPSTETMLTEYGMWVRA